MVTNEELKQAFNDMMATKELLAQRSEEELKAREILKASEAEADLSGKCDGKNAEIRAAQKRQFTAADVLALGKAEVEKRKAQLEYELACMRADCLKWQIRNAQAAADCEAQRLGAI